MGGGGGPAARPTRDGDRPATPDPDDAATATEVAARILAGAAQSAAALQRRLQRRGFSEAAAQTATAAMASRGYVDDGALAQSIAARRQRTGHGRIAVLAELRRRGVDDEAIDTVVADANPDAERAAALELGRRLAGRGGSGLGDRARQQRIGASLQRRGFDGETVRWVLRQLAVDVEADPPD